MSTTSTDSTQDDRQEAFGERMLQILNNAFLGTLLSLGHRTGLFDRLAEMPPSTSHQIADATGLDERYVREWLGGMTVARIVEYEPIHATYRLPPEHASFLTRAAGVDNFAFFMQYLALIGQVEDEVVEAFRSGGGVPYSSYPTFQRLQAEETARIFDAALVDTIIPLAPGLPQQLQTGIDVLDVGCGHGHAINVLAQAFPASRFTGIDISDEGIAAARAEAAELNLTNVRFEVQDAADLEGTYDLVFAYDVIHDLAHPTQVLKAIARSLRPGGVFLMADIHASSHLEENLDHPLGPLLYAFSVFYCMTTSLAQEGAGLGTVCGEQTAHRMLQDAGFSTVNIKHVEGDILNTYYICRR